ncbi:hypothetical protein ACTPOK_00875 [Streptomyces inhibens]|uniref:hypothetical protein n=1 Tax=Streptomyces inhibens TaxID=2293571 RepID=UPI00402B001C
MTIHRASFSMTTSWTVTMVDGNDVRMVAQLRGVEGFALGTLQPLGLLGGRHRRRQP